MTNIASRDTDTAFREPSRLTQRNRDNPCKTADRFWRGSAVFEHVQTWAPLHPQLVLPAPQYDICPGPIACTPANKTKLPSSVVGFFRGASAQNILVIVKECPSKTLLGVVRIQQIRLQCGTTTAAALSMLTKVMSPFDQNDCCHVSMQAKNINPISAQLVFSRPNSGSAVCQF